MIIDNTGIELIPGNNGIDCPGNGHHAVSECCCDECDYMLCCLFNPGEILCKTCTDTKCPRRN